MSDDSVINVEEFDMERRLHTRHRARTQVFITPPGQRRVGCTAVNLSANGVAVKTEKMGLRGGTVCDLAFVINLGSVVKIHRRSAKVCFVKNGVTGFSMEQYQGK